MLEQPRGWLAAGGARAAPGGLAWRGDKAGRAAEQGRAGGRTPSRLPPSFDLEILQRRLQALERNEGSVTACVWLSKASGALGVGGG